LHASQRPFRHALTKLAQSTVSPDLLFVLSLAVKMAVTAAFVVIATFAAERAGPVVGGMISTVPVSAGPVYVFLALDHDVAFIADSALSSFVANAANSVFALIYVVLAQRCGLALSIIPAMAAWFVLAALIRSVAWTAPSAIAIIIVVVGSCLLVGNRLRHALVPLVVRRWYDMPLRAAMGAILVAVVVGISAQVGPAITGILAVFPIMLSSMMIILHPRLGGPASAAVLANSLLGLVGFSTACLTAHFAVMLLGTPAGLTVALIVNVACNLAFWAIRRVRPVKD
jgi:hypothetical protein